MRMYKHIALTVLLHLLFFIASAQPARAPMGIPDLSIGNLQPIPKLEVADLSIASNQTITGITDCGCQSGCSVLPVDMLSFEGKRENAVLVKLNWKTGNEVQNKGFEVQRSLGNTNSFDSIAFVPAKLQGGYINEYELPDNNDYSGISYYRLQQIDLDGNSNLSNIVSVKGYVKESSLSLYPNPVKEKLTADIFYTRKTTAVLLLTDATQKLLYSVTLPLNKGMNLINIPCTHLAAGLYFVRVITADNKVMPGKFIKL